MTDNTINELPEIFRHNICTLKIDNGGNVRISAAIVAVTKENFAEKSDFSLEMP